LIWPVKRTVQLGLLVIYLRPADSRLSKAVAKVWIAGFQPIDQGRYPLPFGPRLMIAM